MNVTVEEAFYELLKMEHSAICFAEWKKSIVSYSWGDKMQECPYCGELIGDYEIICPYCGAILQYYIFG